MKARNLHFFVPKMKSTSMRQTKSMDAYNIIFSFLFLFCQRLKLSQMTSVKPLRSSDHQLYTPIIANSFVVNKKSLAAWQSYLFPCCTFFLSTIFFLLPTSVQHHYYHIFIGKFSWTSNLYQKKILGKIYNVLLIMIEIYTN